MTKKELLEYLEGVPDDAIIYAEADHSQTPLRAHSVWYCSSKESSYNGEELDWRGKKTSKTKQVLIQG